MTLEEIYRRYGEEGAEGEKSRALLGQAHWFASCAEFDPKTGEALPQALSGFLTKLSQFDPAGTIRDRLWRITEHARPSVERLLRTLNESPRREQALLPIHAVRELDANSFIKLSNRPGRNFREKLSGKPYLQAVRRYQSINLPENRLLKAFVVRLVELLELRRDLLGETEDDLIPRIYSWLRASEAQAIARWENLPPNNTLLAHRDYRRVWDSWRWLQSLDDDLAHDLDQLEVREETLRKWNEYGQIYASGTHRFADMPVLFNYETFAIQPWVRKRAVEEAARKIPRSDKSEEVSEPACIDLTILRPRYATSRGSSMALREACLWQQWSNDHESVDIELFHSDAAYLHEDATTIASTDLFFVQEDIPDPFLDRAARAFANKLRATFKNDNLSWLVPDFINDFQLEILRRNLNARFTGAEPLPRSVAAVFEQVDYAKVNSDGFPVVVVDGIGGKTSVTKLIARFDPELKNRLPETRGYYWERCPPVILPVSGQGGDNHDQRQGYELTTLDSNGQWHAPARAKQTQFPNTEMLKRDPRIERFAFCANLSKSPVAGGARLLSLQQRAGDIPLWRDQIPELSIKVRKDRRYQRFYLVERGGTTVKPIRGKSVTIPVAENFILPAGRPNYRFPLFQGENADELGFSARLDSPAFPLKEKAECKLHLTFEYGADEPYKLVFVPLEKSFPPIRATWRRTAEEVVTDAPSPGYPNPISWDDLRRMPKPGSVETRDFLEWFVSTIDNLQYEIEAIVRPEQRFILEITADWRVDRKGKNYTFATNAGGSSVFIHESAFLPEFNYDEFRKGDFISCEILQSAGDRLSGRRVATSRFEDDPRSRSQDLNSELVRSFRRRLYVPVIQIWRDGRSITDRECPKQFAKDAAERRSYLANLIEDKRLPEDIRCELLFLLSCLHKDAPSECVRWITDQVEISDIGDRQAVGYSLGDVSREWQLHVFRLLASRPGNATLSVFSYAIWRDVRIVDRFSVKEILPLLDVLLLSLGQLVPTQDKDGIQYMSSQPLELLLGLLRIRASEDPEIRMLLQPHQKITKHLAEQIDRIEEVVAEANITLFSRVQIDVQKPEGDRTPDLLYALRLYLTGDDGANSIHITSVSDSDDD